MTDNMLIDRTVVEQALKVLEYAANDVLTGRNVAEALRAALDQPQNHVPDAGNMVPAGWKLVPEEPTDDMREAGKVAHYEAETRTSDSDAWILTGFAHRVVRASYIYRAMLAAAPQPPATQRGISAPNARLIQVIDALTSYCKTGEIDGADDLLAELLFERDHPTEVGQPQVGEIVVTTNLQGQCVAVTRQDDESQILSVIWEAKQPQVEQEPVAYRHRSFTCDPWEYVSLDDKQRFREGMGQPLYTSPQHKREPLTEEQLHTLWLYAPVDNYTTHEELFQQAARLTERAHGIGTPNDSKTN